MAKFLTTIKTSSAIEEIILAARKDIVLVSPYLQLSVTFLERLQDASNNKVHITIVYGKSELKNEDKKKLASIKNLTVYFSPNLHAKCYFNEIKMVITSMNMYEFSERNNREMGILIDAKDDEEIYLEAVKETQSIINHARKEGTYANETCVDEIKYHKNGKFNDSNVPPINVNLTYKNWKNVVGENLSSMLNENFSFYNDRGNIIFRSRSHTFYCSILNSYGNNYFNIDKILSGKYYDFLKPLEKDIRKISGLDFKVYEGVGNSYSTCSLHNHPPLETYDFSFVCEVDLPTIADAILNFGAIIDDVHADFEKQSYHVAK